MSRSRIAIDFRWLDHLSLGNGQYRYVTDLILGLDELDATSQFVVLGSRPVPAPGIAPVFRDRERWEYHSIPRLAGRGAAYREQLRYQFLLRRLRIDLLHEVQTFVPVFSPVPVVTTVYDLMLELFPEYAAIVQSREYRMHQWTFQHFASRAVAISKTTASDLHRLWNYPADRIDVVYLGTDLPASEGGEQRQPPPIFLAPYNLEPRKNLRTLLEVAARLREVGWRFQLVLFGRAAVNDVREREFQAHLDRLELRTCTTLTGYVSDEELANLYHSASVFVFPSLYEGFGLPVLEAMRAGVCVVAHHDSAMAEVVANAGVLVDMRSVEAICEGVMKAMGSPELGTCAARRARAFSRERMASETMAAYEKALAESVSRVRRRPSTWLEQELRAGTVRDAGEVTFSSSHHS